MENLELRESLYEQTFYSVFFLEYLVCEIHLAWNWKNCITLIHWVSDCQFDCRWRDYFKVFLAKKFPLGSAASSLLLSDTTVLISRLDSAASLLSLSSHLKKKGPTPNEYVYSNVLCHLTWFWFDVTVNTLFNSHFITFFCLKKSNGCVTLKVR